MSLELIIARPILVGILVATILFSYFRGNKEWTNPLFMYILSSTIIYFIYVFSGAEFENGISISGEFYYVLNLLLSTFACIFAAGVLYPKNISPPLMDKKFLPSILKILIVPMVISLAILLLRLTNGNLFLLFDLSGGNAMKWLRITERDPIVFITEAIFLSLVSIAIPASILTLAQGKKLFIAVSFSSYILYLLSTGSRSPAIALILMLIVPVLELRRRGYNSRWVQRLIRASVIIVATLFIAVTVNRDKIEDNSDEMLKAVFSAKDLGFVANSQYIPYGIQLPSTIVSIYFASTYNNYIIAYEQSSAMEKTWGYRLFYTQYKAFNLLFSDSGYNNEIILSDNTEHLRSISPTGDQWATNLGTLVLEFGLLYSLLASIIQGFVMGWLMRTSKRLESNRRIILSSLLFTLAITSSLVHPLMSFSVHIHVLIIFIVSIVWLRRTRSNIQRPTKIGCSMVRSDSDLGFNKVSNKM